ncbi:inositol monophosphatase family protein [Acrocarpospora macrocephala]|uniref:Inositol monophosphatase n=1 Tax=Acrocarpospora macrocephala TaxID=150177 RepID=A0A5M3X2A0_9ACTN|nr:inositol monophosphatase family protein [Acrocarpospora macrocephala]GES15855.1 inositol monophosphatase [Acrocarpospora macrocephala]
MDVTAELGLAIEAVEAAGELLREEPQWIEAKGDGADVLTDLDLRVEELIVGRLRAAYPHDQIFAEESGASGADGDRVWLVDPLDGTNNVAIGLPVYAVGIALCVGKLPQAGVVHDPVSRRTWSAVRGAGAHGPGLPPDPPPGRRSLLLAWTQGHSVGREDATARGLRTALEAKAGRLLQLWAPLVGWTLLARGKIDGFIGYRAELVDLPAGALIAHESGVELRAFDGGLFDQRIDLPEAERNFIACRPGHLAEIRSALAGELEGLHDLGAGAVLAHHAEREGAVDGGE